MRILFVTATRLGDAVLSTGLLAHLAAGHPTARFTIACGAPAAPVFGALPGLERIIIVRKQKGGLHWLKLWAATVGTFWHRVIDLRGSALGWLIPAAGRAVIGRDNGGHRVKRLGAVLGLDPPPAPRVWTGGAHRENAAHLIPEGGPVLAVGPTANWIGKQWRAEYFAELIARLTGPGGLLPGARVALFGAMSERAAARAVIESVPAARRIDLVGRIDLLTVAACLERTAFYVGNDSGLMHLAAAMNVPTLGLFGPSRDDLYGPWGPRGAVVRAATPYLELFGPDHGATFDPTATGTLMDSLSVDMAETAARALWTRTHAEAA